jgi:hypothetical protein
MNVNIDPINYAFNLKLTPILQRLFGADIIQKANAAGIKTARDIFELTSANTQCSAVIGKLESGTPCWICGLPIQKKTRGFAIKSKGPATDVKSGVTAECEHILPVAQASILLNLYNPAMKGVNDDFLTKSLKLEYGWAHVVCNQEKGSICPIIVKSDGRFEVDHDQIKYMLQRIKRSTRSDSYLLRTLIKAYEKRINNEFVKTRLPIVIDRYDKIIQFISRVDDPNAAKLVVFAGIASLTDAQKINPKLHEAIHAVESIDVNSIKPIMSEKDKHISELVINTYNDIRERIKYTLQTNPENNAIWKKISGEFTKYTSYLSGNVETESETNYSSNLFKFLIHLNSKYPEAIGKDDNRIALSLFIYIKMLDEMLDYMENTNKSETNINLMSNLLDNYKKFIDSDMYKRLEDDYHAYETGEITNAASILTAMKISYKTPRHIQYKTLKTRHTRRLKKRINLDKIKHSIKTKQTRKLKGTATIKKLANVMENETTDKIQHVTRSGRGATRLKL